MHAQIISFNFKELSYEEWSAFCDQIAQIIADLQGLISKVWLENRETNTYGGVYLWRDREAMAAAMQTDLFQLPKHPNLANVGFKEFGVALARHG
jgi:hypothetical protein